MHRNLISGVIISEFDHMTGPICVYVTPEIYDENTLRLIAIKTIDNLFLEDVLPEIATLMDFPSFGKKGLVKPFMWENPKLRGGLGEATVTILFEEKDELLFYKYRADIEIAFNEFIEHFNLLKENHKDKRNYAGVVDHLIHRVMNLLDNIAAVELNSDDQEMAFPSMKQADRKPDLTLKFIIIGDAEVGKTSTILRYTDDAFKRSYIPTIQVNISPKNIYIKDKWIQLVLWDLAGQAKYNLIRSQFYEGAAAILFLFDLTYPDSFSNVHKWMQDVKNSVPNFNQMALALCGNKSDLEHQIAISPAQIQQLYRDLQLPYYQISALTGKNIKQVFEDLLQKVLEKLKF